MTADGATSQDPVRYCGRDFTPAELEEIRSLAASLPTRRAIADAVCDALLWHRADGRRKDMTARVALNRIHADGLIALPPPRHDNGRHPRHAPAGQLPCPSAPSRSPPASPRSGRSSSPVSPAAPSPASGTS